MGAMAKFKVGDRVLITANEDGEGEGKTAVIIHMCSPYWAHVRFEQPIDGWGKGGQEWGVGVEKLELIADKPTSLQEEVESGRMSVDAARRHLGLDPAPNSTAGYTVPLCAYEESEADKAGDLVINVASNLSEINDELRTAIKLVKKLGKASKKYGIDIAHYTAAA